MRPIDCGDGLRIRTVSPEDAGALLAIYRPYVEKTAITFEYETPPEDAFASRIRRTLERYPYLAAAKDREIVGYAYTGPFVGRAAYSWSAEVSIYLREDRRGMGIGRKLYAAIEEISRAQHLTNLYACIGTPDEEDQYLTFNSVRFHSRMGYRRIGEFSHCGYKFGRWYNMVWMEKIIGEHDPAPAAFVPFPALEG